MLSDGRFTHSCRVLLVLLVFTFETPAFSATAELRLENELLLDLRIDGVKIGMDVLGYQRGEDFLLSLEELASGLAFPIAVDLAQGVASGWYISEDRLFSLDLKRAEVISGEIRWPLAKGEAVIFEDGLYVETKALQKWFPLNLSAVVRELYLDVEPTELLPIQKRFNRRQRVVTHSSRDKEPLYPLQETPYQFFSPHITRLRLGYSTVRQTPDSDAVYGNNYASLSRGDLGWMTSTLSLAGQNLDSTTGARLKLERTAFDGPLGLNHIELGDVDAGGYRGFLIRGGGRREQGRRFDAESVNLEGSQLPDWDVELYQNDQLIMTQTVEQDGRYLFEDIPLRFGENRFELKFFGPSGETESREEFHFLGAGMLEPGHISYEVAAVQSGRTVFGVNDSDGEGDRNSGIYTGDFNLGLSRNLTVSAGIRSKEKEGDRLATSNYGIGLSTSRFYARLSYVDSPDAQNSVSTSLRTRLGDTNLNLGFTRYLDELEPLNSLQKWRSDVDITSTVFSLPMKLEVNTQEQENSTRFDAVLGTTIPLLGSGKLSSSLWFGSIEERLDGNKNKTSITGGLTSFHTNINPWSFRLSASYGFEPETELLELSADSSLRIDTDLSLDLTVRQKPSIDTTYYEGGINWQLEKVAINARVSYDSDERWGGLITLSTALVHKPKTLRPKLDSRASVSAGYVEVRVFEEQTEGERIPQAGVDVKGVQTWRNATTDERGVAYLSNMLAHRQVDIEIDEFMLTESDLRSKIPGVSVIPRPGSYAVVEFPIIRTAELEGHIIVDNGAVKNPVSRALVLLKTTDGEVFARTRTAFDGFFLFDGIEPGVYHLSIEEELEKRILHRPSQVKVLANSGIIRELDFNLRAVEANKLALDNRELKLATLKQPIAVSSLGIPPLIARAVPDVETQTKPQLDEGKWFVQLGAYGSRELAQTHWEQLSDDNSLFMGKTPRYVQYQKMTRLLVGPGLNKNSANQYCQQLQENNLDCLVRSVE